MTTTSERRCRQCGCADNNACQVEEEPFLDYAGILGTLVEAPTCWWVGPDLGEGGLCSGCALNITVVGPVVAAPAGESGA